MFFDVIDKIDDDETQRKYLQNLKKLILTENSNKLKRLNQLNILWMKFLINSKGFKGLWILKILKKKYKKWRKQIEQLKQENEQIKQENEQIRNILQYIQENFAETSDNQNLGIIIPNKETLIESFINIISKIDF